MDDYIEVRPVSPGSSSDVSSFVVDFVEVFSEFDEGIFRRVGENGFNIALDLGQVFRSEILQLEAPISSVVLKNRRCYWG